jgi:hypothetical protein
LRFLCLLLAVASWSTTVSFAHDIPSSTTVLMYVKPESDRLSVLVRVPMETLGEIQYPVRGPGYLDLDRVDESLAEAVRIYLGEGLRFFVDGENLGAPLLQRARVSLPSDMSFGDYESALTHINLAPLTNDVDLFWNQAMLDVQLSYGVPPGLTDRDDSAARISFRAQLDRLAVEAFTALRYLPVDGVERAYNYVGDPGVVELDPGWWSAVSRFVVLGFFHILEGWDHLLFLFALMIPLRSIGALVLVVSSFTIAHTITLLSSALGMTPSALWFPALIEALIALSIFYMACENLFSPRQDQRWMMAFGFGLIHGFGFSFILADRLQFAGNHFLGSLFAFNIGVELGQLAVVVLTVPALWLVFRYVFKGVAYERIGIVLLSALVGHSAWHWSIERVGQLLQYSWQPPVLDAPFFAAALRWAMLVVGSALVLLVMHELVSRLRRDTDGR